MRVHSRYAPIGFTYHADIYCHDCGVTLPDTDPEGNAKGVVMPWEEVAEYDENDLLVPAHCGECGEVIQ
jgi:hypothetical protein